MITRRLVAFFAIALICLTLNSCKKSTDKNASCRIVTATQVLGANTSIFNITYNNEGKISTLVATGSLDISKVFTYSGNTIIINSTNGGAFQRRDSVTLNDKGKPLNIRQYTNVGGTTWTNYAMEYNGDILLKYHETTQAAGAPKTVTITTTSGNATVVQVAGTTINLEYHTDKNVQRGDYLEFAALVEYGVNIYPHKNLIKTVDTGGGSITNYNYEFNSDGLISKVIGTSGASSTTITYQYQCN
jgi:hypothetical protein